MDQSDLRKSISEMTDEELQEAIDETRTSRRAGAGKKRAAAKKRTTKKNAKDATEELASLFGGMSEEEKQAFIKQLEDND